MDFDLFPPPIRDSLGLGGNNPNPGSIYHEKLEFAFQTLLPLRVFDLGIKSGGKRVEIGYFYRPPGVINWLAVLTTRFGDA